MYSYNPEVVTEEMESGKLFIVRYIMEEKDVPVDRTRSLPSPKGETRN